MEFDFSLAELLSLPVERMRHVISNREYVQWRALANVRKAREQVKGG